MLLKKWVDKINLLTMTIRESQSESLALSFGKPSHRTRPEQFVGLGIYLSIALGFEAISKLPAQLMGTLYFISLGLGMWALWRRYSLRVLKLELSTFLAQFFFQIAWSLSFTFEQSLLALVTLLLLWCNTLLATLLFWKKEKISGILYLFPLIWIFYLAIMNMGICISNP